MGTEQKRRRQRELQRRRQRRIKRIIRLIMLCLFAGIIIGLGGLWKEYKGSRGTEIPGSRPGVRPTELAEKKEQESGDASVDVSGMALDTQRILQDREVEEQLLALAAASPETAEIYRNRAAYPEELLKAFAHNPEMLDFVKGYPDADGSVTGGFTEEETEQSFPLLLQWDARWGYYPYGGSCIGIAGCGPTCLSMVILSLTGDESATPDVLADYSMNNGHYVAGQGTAWTLMTEAPGLYGVSVSELGLDKTAMEQVLDWGGMIICAMRPGDFTTAGHFIVIYGYDAEGFLVNDPNSRERSAKRWFYDDIWYQIKNLWAYGKA